VFELPLIIDTNRASDFGRPLQDHAKEIRERVSSKRMTICTGGRLTRELSNTKLSKLLGEWGKAGRLKRVSDAEVNAREVELSGTITSNDGHIIAIAQIAGCRLLFSDDQALINDFTNVSLVSSPKGKVVKSNARRQDATRLFNLYGK